MIPGGPQISASGLSDDSTARTWFGFSPSSSRLAVTSPSSSKSPSVRPPVSPRCFPTTRPLKEQQIGPSLTSLPTASIIALAVASSQISVNTVFTRPSIPTYPHFQHYTSSIASARTPGAVDTATPFSSRPSSLIQRQRPRQVSHRPNLSPDPRRPVT